jgi:hypothetical protein
MDQITMWFRKSKKHKEITTMPSLQEQIIPAIQGTLYLHFAFFVSVKASEGQVKERTIRRSVVCWRLEGDRLIPIPYGLPVELDPEAPCCSAVVTGGQILDCLTGQAFASDELWIRHATAIWKNWLQENRPPVAAVEPPSVKGTITYAGTSREFTLPA